MTNPVSVIVPSLSSRREFLTSRCLPAVSENAPAELFVIISDGGGDGNSKRNMGASLATQKYIMFVDDDCTLRPGCLSRMILEIESAPDHRRVDFVYSDYRKFSDPKNFPKGELKTMIDFSPKALRTGNYINTMSLIRRSAFPGFDPEIKRFQDWDLWLTMVSRGSNGSYIREQLFDMHVIDRSLSATVPFDEAYKAVVRKHGL